MDDSEYQSKLSSAGSTFSKFGSAIGKGAVVIGKVTAAAAGAAASGIVAMTKKAVENYAEYEQLVGGVETLFKTSSDQVMKYANNAYKTAGLSANEYMETVTSFSASLFQSLDGDTKKSAEYADRAIIDMSDNANKMGTSMESIQNAYNGFAKQNYTMLDNLKLGYGGTKEEMERLIEDASKMTDIQSELGVSVDASSMSFGNIVNAISVMQKSLDISGTTAKEASSTISGSINTMKSAWSNLVTSVADDNADFDGYMDNFVTSVSTVAKNIIPRVQIAIQGIGKLISGVAPVLLSELPVFAQEVLPGMIETLSNVAKEAVETISSTLPDLTNELIPGMVELIVGLIPTMTEAVIQLTVTLAQVLVEQAPSIISALYNGIVAQIPTIVSAGQNMINGIVSGFKKSFPAIEAEAKNIINNLASGLETSLPVLIPEAINVITKLVEYILDNIDVIIDAGIKILEGLANGIVNSLPLLIEKAPVIIDKLLTAIVNNVPKILLASAKIITTLCLGLIQNIPNLIAAVPKIITSLKDKLIEYGKNLWEVGKQLVIYIKDKIVETWEIINSNELVQRLKDKFLSAIASIKEVGRQIIENIKQGITDAWNGFVSWLESKIKFLTDKIKPLTSVFNKTSGSGDDTNARGTINGTQTGSYRSISSNVASGVSTADNTQYLSGILGELKELNDSGISTITETMRRMPVASSRTVGRMVRSYAR